MDVKKKGNLFAMYATGATGETHRLHSHFLNTLVNSLFVWIELPNKFLPHSRNRDAYLKCKFD